MVYMLEYGGFCNKRERDIGYNTGRGAR